MQVTSGIFMAEVLSLWGSMMCISESVLSAGQTSSFLLALYFSESLPSHYQNKTILTFKKNNLQLFEKEF